MGYKRRIVAYFFAFFGFGVLAVAGFGYWGYALHTGDPSGQIFGITFGGIFGVMWLAFFFVAVEGRKTYPTRTRYRY